MTVQQVRARVAEIAQAAYQKDDGKAHMLEDDLFQDVMTAIVRGVDNPVDIADEALKAKAIDFARWCA